MKNWSLFVVFLALFSLAMGNKCILLDSNVTILEINPIDSAANSKPPIKKNKKEGIDWIILPSLGFGSDIGFKYGAAFLLFDFGKPTIYPDFKSNIHIEVSRTTKGINDVVSHYYKKNILKTKFNLLANVYYRNEFAYDFWGFNGSQSFYNPKIQDPESSDFLSGIFYKIERTMFRSNLEFSYSISKETKVLFGWNMFNVKVNKAEPKKPKNNSNILDTDSSLYQKYVQWGVIPESDKNGGLTNVFKLGVSFDNRNHEASPSKGILTDLMFICAPAALQSNGKFFLKMSASIHNYVNIYKEKIVLASRLMYQTTLLGTSPFYLESFLFSSRINPHQIEGLGGSKTIRGIDRNRVISDGFLLFNTEIRYKLFNFNLFKQSFCILAVPFIDAGITTKPISFDKTKVPENKYLFYDKKDKIHAAAGMGFHLIVNENINLSLDYGISITEEPYRGLYLGFNYIF